MPDDGLKSGKALIELTAWAQEQHNHFWSDYLQRLSDGLPPPQRLPLRLRLLLRLELTIERVREAIAGRLRAVADSVDPWA